MNRLVPFLAASLLAGCMTPTWKSHVAGSPVQDDRVILPWRTQLLVP